MRAWFLGGSGTRFALRCVALFCIVVVLCVAALLLARCLPQEAVARNLSASLPLLERETDYAYITQDNSAYMLDNYSDALILSHSYYTNTRVSPASVFSNPRYRGGGPVSSLAEAVRGELAPNWEYSHYWMGFRVPVRALLAITDYGNIRMMITWTVGLLLLAAVLVLARLAGTRAAVCLAVAVLSVNLTLIWSSMQFSCCFILALAGVLIAARRRDRPRALCVLFLLLGQLTQYFDFYTTPVLTYGLPMIALLFIARREGRLTGVRESFAEAGRHLLFWAAGYAGMWIVRMLLVSCFTDINGFAILTSFADYTGVASAGGTAYSARDALEKAFWRIFTVPGFAVYALTLLLWGAGMLARRKACCRAAFTGGLIYLALMLIPLIWIAVGAKAFVAHCWFQYRILCMSIFAAYGFLSETLPARSGRALPQGGFTPAKNAAGIQKENG